VRLLIVILVLALPASAHAQGTLERAADGLREDNVYVDPDAERALSGSEENRLEQTIRRADAGPVYVAVLPDEARDEAGGDPGAALREIALDVGEPGTYAAVVGDSLRAGATGGVLPEGEAGRLADQALGSSRDEGTAAVLTNFVGRVADARAGDGSGGSGGSDGGGFPVFLLVLLGIPLVLFAVSRSRRRRREREELAEVKSFARDDLVSLGEDIRALDLDMQMPEVDPVAREYYGRAVERYQAAEDAWERASHVDDLERVASLLEEGRYEMTAARARLEGRPVPEHRPPCFFDPRHGPSVEDVEWAPPGGQPRPVPVCAADAARLADGLDPDVRQVPVAGGMAPYWNAGPAYLPWAGGFFGGGLLPGLFIGSMLGGGLGLFGAAGADAAVDEPAGDFGDFGGGDFGGFGGGDFGGGGDF
jgi:hypothetical protein